MARMDKRPVSRSGSAAHCIQAAVRVFGADLRSAHPPEDSDQPPAVGVHLFQLIFGDQTRQGELEEILAALADDPDVHTASDALEGLVSDALRDDPAVAAAVLETLTEFYRRQAQAGNVQALADLGNLLRRTRDFDGAKAAYQQAIDAGWHEALIDMAHLLRPTDTEAARACLDQAMTVGDPDLTARALVTLSAVLGGSDPDGAESALLQAIETGHPEWADRSRYELAYMLKEEGDLAGAREQYQRLVENGNEHWAAQALESLIILLQDDGDVDGLRALHRTAVQTRNESTPEVLVTLGFLLEERGDADGARAAFQQAIDDGLHGADWLIEKMHPSPKPTAAELDALPSLFDPRNMVRTGMEVLDHGLPELPEQLNYLMVIPVAYWTTQQRAVVLFLKFEREGRQHYSGVLHVTYSRDTDGWTPHRHFVGMGYGHDPIANPGSLRDLGGSAMLTGGGTDTQPHGRASPAVKYIALIQDGHEDLRPLESHFGAWVVSTEASSPFQVEGRDADGNVLARFSYDPDDYR
jgi:tetratricopeptide (TPR) repeat protein